MAHVSKGGTSRAPHGWVLFDAECGVCSRWVPFWAPTLARLGLGVAKLHEPWVAERLDASREALLHDIRLLFADGRAIAGADVYRYVMRRVWWTYPLYLVTLLPGARQLFDSAYRAFADRRLRISAACRLPPAR